MNGQSIYKSPQGEQIIMAHYDRVLAHWLVPYQPVTVPTRHGETFIIASGDPHAPALMLLHGSASNAVSWIGEAAAYSVHFRVYAVDIPGEPGRSSQNRPSWDGPAFAEWVEDVLNGLHAERASLLGISQGWLDGAQVRYSAAGTRLEKLVLLAPGGVAAVRPSFLLHAIPLSLMGRWGAERINCIVFGDTPMDPEAVVFMNEILSGFKPRIEPQTLFTDEELRRLTMPVLLIAGRRDALLPSEKTAQRLQALLPDVTVNLRPEAGHVLYDVSPQVIKWMLAHEPAPAIQVAA